MLDNLLRHKKEEKEYLIALLVSENRIDAALWETDHGGHAQVLKTSIAYYEGEWEKAIDAADKTISDVESNLPPGTEIKKVVFGLFPEWIGVDHIKEVQLKQLKQLTTALSLTPVGFVDVPTAVAHLLAKDEGTQQTVILVGLEKKHLIVSLFKIGKLISSHTVIRSPNSSQDIEKGLKNFADVEVLPSRMLVYGTTQDLEEVKNDMLSYPWQDKANFLHFPKIDALSYEYGVKAVAFASALELTSYVEESANNPVADVEVNHETTAMPTQVDSKSEVDQIAVEDLGFTTEKTDVSTTDKEPHLSIDNEADVENVIAVETATKSSFKGKIPGLPKLSNITLPKFSLPIKFPHMQKLSLILAVVFALFLIVGSGVAAAWILPKATVRVFVQPQIFDKTEEITIDSNATIVDTEKKILPGSVVKTEISGSETVSATGKKTVGDKAKGEVIIFNKTLNSKSFKKGTVLSAGKLIFTLDSEVNIASASESGDSLKYGMTKASIIASAIGTASNLPGNTDFSFEGLPNTSYVARSDGALSGGTSRDISVISREDVQSARIAAQEKLEEKAEGELVTKISGEQKILDNSLKTKSLTEAFSKEVGEEATDLTADVTLLVEAVAYNESDFFKLLDGVIGSQIAQGYEYKKSDSKIAIDSIIEEDGVWTFKPHITLKLIPKVEINEYAKKLTNKKLTDATDYLKSQPQVAGVEYDIFSPLPFLRNTLPMNSKNISIQLEAL